MVEALDVTDTLSVVMVSVVATPSVDIPSVFVTDFLQCYDRCSYCLRRFTGTLYRNSSL